MKKIMEIQNTFVPEPVVQEWLGHEFAEDDFLLGKTPEFSPDLCWEDEG